MYMMMMMMIKNGALNKKQLNEWLSSSYSLLLSFFHSNAPTLSAISMSAWEERKNCVINQILSNFNYHRSRKIFSLKSVFVCIWHSFYLSFHSFGVATEKLSLCTGMFTAFAFLNRKILIASRCCFSLAWAWSWKQFFKNIFMFFLYVTFATAAEWQKFSKRALFLLNLCVGIDFMVKLRKFIEKTFHF